MSPTTSFELAGRMFRGPALHLALIVFRARGGIEAWSSGAVALLGWSEAEAAQKRLPEFLFPSPVRLRFRKVMEQLPRRRREIIPLPTHTKAGELVNCLWQLTLLETSSAGDHLVAALGQPSIGGVSSLELLHELLEVIHPEPALLVDREWRILDCNDPARKTLGSCIGCFCREFFPSRQDWQRAFHRVERGLRRRGRFSLRAVVDLPSGERVPLEIRGSELSTVDGVLLIARELSLQEELRRYQTRLRAMGYRLLELEQRERNRIATELHDKLAQELTLLRWKAAEIKRTAGFPEHLNALCEALIEQIDGLLEGTKKLVLQLRSPPFSNLPFVPALEKRLTSLGEAFQLDCQLTTVGEIPDLRGTRRSVVFQVLQEAVLNVVRHAQAKSVRVSLQANAGELKLEIRDDGVGMSKQELEAAMASPGIQGMLRRANQVGGTLKLESETGKGTKVILSLPLPRGRER